MIWLLFALYILAMPFVWFVYSNAYSDEFNPPEWFILTIIIFWPIVAPIAWVGVFRLALNEN